jgi:shikimate dehydrogenase
MSPTAPAVYSVAEFLDLAASRPADAPLCAVLGRPVAHSLSPVIHRGAADAAGAAVPGSFDYVRVEAGETGELRQLTTSAPVCVRGFSVTMPGKPVALALADEVTDRAAAVGSANTLIPLGGGRWRAENTDVAGVAACLDAVAGENPLHRAAVVGNGGTARPAVAALAAAGVGHVEVIARSDRALRLRGLVEGYGMTFAWTRLDDPALGEVCAGCEVLVSTVPAAAAAPVAPALAQAAAVVDVIYDPYPTDLLAAARAAGRPAADGLLMLAGQGVEQFRLFTGATTSTSAMYSLLKGHLGLG